VYAFFERWHRRGLPEALVHRLREKLRVRQERGAQPTASIMDSQIVRAADTVGKATADTTAGRRSPGEAATWQ
jgi:transposase